MLLYLEGRQTRRLAGTHAAPEQETHPDSADRADIGITTTAVAFAKAG